MRLWHYIYDDVVSIHRLFDYFTLELKVTFITPRSMTDISNLTVSQAIFSHENSIVGEE